MLLPLVTAPTLIVVATAAERWMGPVVAGAVAAAPVTIAVAVLAVAADTGPASASTLALSAAAHVVAQTGCAGAFVWALARRGLVTAFVVGAAGYAFISLLVPVVPMPVATVIAVPALVLAGRAVRPAAGCGPICRNDVPAKASRPVPSGWLRTAALRAGLVCLAVAAILTAADHAGPVVAGAIGAFPATSTVLALTSGRRHGATAAGRVVRGLVGGLPAYLSFCATAAIVTRSLGAPTALLAAPLVCLLTYRLLWNRPGPGPVGTAELEPTTP